MKGLFAFGYLLMMGGAYAVIGVRWVGVAVALLGITLCLAAGARAGWWR